MKQILICLLMISAAAYAEGDQQQSLGYKKFVDRMDTYYLQEMGQEFAYLSEKVNNGLASSYEIARFNMLKRKLETVSDSGGDIQQLAK